MFEIHFIVFLDLINIYTDTKTIKIEAFTANLQAHPVFRAAILNFEFLAGKPRATIWFPLFLNSAYSKTPRCKFSCFYPEVHDMAEKCHISAPLKGTLYNVLVGAIDFYILIGQKIFSHSDLLASIMKRKWPISCGFSSYLLTYLLTGLLVIDN